MAAVFIKKSIAFAFKLRLFQEVLDYVRRDRRLEVPPFQPPPGCTLANPPLPPTPPPSPKEGDCIYIYEGSYKTYKNTLESSPIVLYDLSEIFDLFDESVTDFYFVYMYPINSVYFLNAPNKTYKNSKGELPIILYDSSDFILVVDKTCKSISFYFYFYFIKFNSYVLFFTPQFVFDFIESFISTTYFIYFTHLCIVPFIYVFNIFPIYLFWFLHKFVEPYTVVYLFLKKLLLRKRVNDETRRLKAYPHLVITILKNLFTSSVFMFVLFLLFITNARAEDVTTPVSPTLHFIVSSMIRITELSISSLDINSVDYHEIVLFRSAVVVYSFLICGMLMFIGFIILCLASHLGELRSPYIRPVNMRVVERHARGYYSVVVHSYLAIVLIFALLFCIYKYKQQELTFEPQSNKMTKKEKAKERTQFKQKKHVPVQMSKREQKLQYTQDKFELDNSNKYDIVDNFRSAREEQPLFSSWYGNKSTPTWMLNFKVSDVDALLGSIINSSGVCNTPMESSQQEEMVRQVKALKGREDELNYLDLAREVIYNAYYYEQDIVLKPQYRYTLPNRVKYDPCDAFEATSLDARHFTTIFTHKGKVAQEVLVTLNSGPNWLFDFFNKNFATKHSMPMNKIKSILRSAIQNRVPNDEILDIMLSKLYLWKNEEEPSSRLSWICSYLPPEFYHYGISDTRRFATVFKDYVRNLQSKVMKFVRDYLSISELSRKDRLIIFRDRRETFRNIMRQPAYQIMFAQGYSKTFITRHINKTFQTRLKRSVHSSKNIKLFKKSKIKSNHRAIQRARDIKYYAFEPESNVQIVDTSNTWWYTWLLRPLLCSSLFPVAYYITQGVIGTYSWGSWVYNWVGTSYHAWAVPLERNRTTIIQAADDLTAWVEFLHNPMSLLQTTTYRPILLEVKSLIHALVYLYYGKKLDAVAWLSNLMFTRPEVVEKMTKLIWSVPTLFQEQRINEDINDEYIELQTASFSDITGTIHSLCHELGFLHISDADVKNANARMQYHNNMKRDHETKMKAVYSVMSVLSRFLYPYDPLDAHYNTFTAKMVQIIKFVDKLNLQENDVYTVPALSEMIEHYKAGSDLLTSSRMSEVPTFFQSLFKMKMAVLGTVTKRASAQLGKGCDRKEPTCVLLTGPPGVGKSALISFVQKAILWISKSPYDPLQTFSYSANSKYWEGYKNQKFVLMDDVFKEDDIDIRRKQATDLISMINVAPMPLEMAFEDKGSVFFDSEYVFCTTNLANDGIDKTALQVGLSDPQALRRRFHIVMHREERISARHHQDFFRIDQCNLLPHRVDDHISVKDIPLFLMEHREAQMKARDGYVVSDETLAELYGEFECQALPEVTLDPVELIKLILKHLHEIPALIDPNMRALFIALFFLCIIIAKVGPIYGYFFGTEVQSSTSDTSHSSGKSVRFKLEGWRPRVKHRGRATHEDHQFNMHECQSSSDFDRALKRNAAKGIIYLYGEAFDGHNRVGQNAVGFHARDGFVCTAAHFYGFFEDLQDCVLTMTWNEKSVEIPWPILNVRLEGEDMVLFKLPQMDRPPEMYKYMLAQKDFFLIEEGQELAVISADEEGEPNVMTVHMKPVQPRVSYQVIGQTILVLSPLGYQCDTVKGDSGGMVFAESVHGKPSLVAMHLAAVKSGISKVGVAITLWKELIDDMIRTISPIQAEVFPHEVLLTVPYDKAHIPPNHSRLKRTVLYGSFPEPVEKVPAKMAPFTTSEGEFIHPLYKAMSKLHQVPTECEPCSDRCLDYLVNLYPRQHGSRVLTPYEALSEYAHPKYIPVNFGTSPGYPYSLGHGKGKAPHIYRDENEKLQFSPYFLGLLESYHTNLLNGNQIQVYWADVLKDETRPLAKVEAGKTRLFSTCPLHYLILIRMYFMDFTLYVQSLAATHPVNVGLNCSSLEWTILYKRLASKKGSVLSGDYENFDGMLPKMLGEKFVRFVNAWYNDGEVNANVRWLLMQHIFAAMHISYTKVYQVFDGNPSGNPITSIYNSFLNIMMIFIVLTEDLGLGEKEFELAVYGDDNIITMSKRGIKCSDIAPHIMRRFGMKYTHFSKEQSDVDDTLLSIRYLNRAFVAVEGILRAPLPLATMREITYWKMSSEAEVEVLKSSADSMFREMSHLPREEFKYLVDFFLEHVDKVAPHLIPYFRQVLLTYDGYIFEMYFSKVEPGKIYPGFCKQIDTGGDCPFLYFETQSHFRIVASKAGVANEVATTQNLEYTDRSTNDLAPTQQVQLGMAQDAAPVSASAMNSQVMQIPYQINNMETFDLNRAVDRMYTLGNPAWTTAQAANTVIGTYNFPDVLFAQDFITNKKNDFSYFRAGIRFVCRCTTSGFVYGTIMIVYQPNVAQDGFLVRGTNVFTGSGYPHILVSAAQGEAAILDVPFIYPKRFIDAKNPPVGSMGRFVVMVLNPLTNINGAVDAAQLTIQAQFLDAELVLPRDSTQSNPGLKKESRKKSSAGIISSALEDHQATGESLDVVKFAKPYTDFFRTFARGVGTAMEVASLMGLSKPTTVEMPKTTTLDVVSTFNYGKGIDLAKKFAMDPEAAIATRPLVGGIDQDEMDLKYVLGTPMLTSTYAMVASTPATIVGTTSPFALLGQYTYVDFVTRNFAFCSGSYKFAAYIEASNLHAVRLVFYLATTAAADYQDCYHRIVDVQGSTYVNFTVPHCVSDFTRDTTTETVYWGVYVKILSWSQPTPAVSAPIFVNVYKAAASDFKVGCLLDMMFTPQSNPRKDFAQIFDPFHPSMMGYEPNAVVYPEEYTTIREIVHRMYPHFAGDTIPVYGPSGTPRVGIELWGIIFMYFRGSVRVQALRKLTGALQATGVARVSGLFLERTDVAGTNIPGLDIGFADKPALSGEAPWYSNLAYKSTTVSEAPVYQFNVPDTVGDSFFCKSAGDDFTYMFLCPPPAGLLAPTDATRGYNALKTWISS